MRHGRILLSRIFYPYFIVLYQKYSTVLELFVQPVYKRAYTRHNHVIMFNLYLSIVNKCIMSHSNSKLHRIVQLFRDNHCCAMKTSFKVIIAILVLTIFSVYIFIKPSGTAEKMNEEVYSGKIQYILYWTKSYEFDDFELGFGRNIFANCLVNNCYTTNNKSFMAVENFDAIVFHGYEYNTSIHGKPEKRKSEQIYIYANLESPIRTPDFVYEKYFFNMTMTYR